MATIAVPVVLVVREVLMSGTFVLCLVIAIAAVAFWRQTLIIAIAVVLALLASGVTAVAQGIAGHSDAPSVEAPTSPGDRPGAPPGASH